MIPALTAKTTAFIVDDDDFLLRDLCDFLPQSHFFKTFTNPLDALAEFKLHSHPSIGCPESLLRDFQTTQFDAVVSVIIVDHVMKPIDGIEFCQRLGSAAPKRIMLTSNKKTDLAIKAFNNRLIDAYLLKHEDDIIDQLSSTIKKCTIEFFKDISAGIDGFKNKHNPLANDGFSKFFFDFCVKNKIRSHCCFHDFHNIILKDIDNKEIYMTIYDNDHLDDLLASEQAKSAKPHVVERILAKEAAPCFKNTKTALIPDGTNWGDFMVPMAAISQDLFLAIS